jgi:hypothetical protein
MRGERFSAGGARVPLCPNGAYDSSHSLGVRI